MTTITSKYQANTRLVFLFQAKWRAGQMALAVPIVFFILSSLALTMQSSARFFSEASDSPQIAAVISTPQRVSKTIEPIGLPARLIIPKIKVDAIIEHVGLTTGGAMAAPSGPKTVAWFALGPRPGQVGSAVIAGHYGYKRSTAAFDILYKIRKGDIIYTVDEAGKYYGFSVLSSRLYPSTSNDSIVFNSGDGRKYLNLITCEGTWDAATKNYSNRRVVFTERLF